MKTLALVILAGFGLSGCGAAASTVAKVDDARIIALEKEAAAARAKIETLEKTVEMLSGPYLGVQWQPAKEGLGIEVVEVVPYSPAADAGIKVGDVLIRAGDVSIKDTQAMLDAMKPYKAGDVLHLELSRPGKGYSSSGKSTIYPCDVKLGAKVR